MAELELKIIPDLSEFKKKFEDTFRDFDKKINLNITQKEGEGGGFNKLLGIVGGIATRVFAAIAIFSMILDAIKPILELITLAVQTLLSPIVILLFYIFRPVLFFIARLIKGIFDLFKPFAKTDEKTKEPGIAELIPTIFNPLEFTKEIKNMIESAFAAKETQKTGGGITSIIPEELINVIKLTTSELINALKSISTSITYAIPEITEKAKSAFLSVVDTIVKIILFSFVMLGTAGLAIYMILIEIMKASFNILTNIGNWITEALIGILTASFSILYGIGLWLWEFLTSTIGATLNILTGIGGWIWTTLTTILQEAFNKLLSVYNLGQSIFNALMEVVNKAVEVARRKFDEIIGEARKTAENIISSASKVVKVKDAIIKPTGEVIQTDPKDYLIATQEPQRFFENRASNINITLNANINSDLDAKKIANQILKEIEINLKRSGNYGGEF